MQHWNEVNAIYFESQRIFIKLMKKLE